MITEINNRCFITIKGEDSKSFLQNIATIDMDKISNENGGWGCVLSPQGKFHYGFFIFEYENTLYLETTNDNIMEFGKYLSGFIINSKIEFGIVKDISVYADLTPNTKCGAINVDGDILYLSDPRHNNMGTRLYAFNDKKVDTDTDFKEYEILRIKNGIPDLEIDAHFNKTYPLEINMDKFNGIDYEKGCYVGQEIVSRMHYRDSVKRNIYTVKAETNINAGDLIIDDTGKSAGGITSAVDNYGLASIRKQYIDDDLFTDKAIKLEVLKD